MLLNWDELMPQKLFALSTFAVVLVLSSTSLAQDADDAARAELERESVVIEPYTGPPIFLPEGDPPVPPRFVENTTVIDYHDPETKAKPKVERQIAKYSDGSVKNSGPYREYYGDGQLFVEGAFDDGKASGEWTYYHPSGELAKVVTYVDGDPDGPVEVMREDGTLEAQREYAAGKRQGVWRAYDETGQQLLREEHYVDGKADGVWQDVVSQWQAVAAERIQEWAAPRYVDGVGQRGRLACRSQFRRRQEARHGKARPCRRAGHRTGVRR